MTGAWRQRLSVEDREELDSWWTTVSADTPPTELELEEAARRNGLEARRVYDESATLDEELHVRLQGPLEEGELPFELGQELFKPLRDSVNAATSAHVDLALAGVIAGSTILRIKATAPLPEDSQASLISPDAVSPSDQAVRTLLDVLAEAEAESDPRAWPAALRSKLPKLADVLYEHNLTAEFTWLASSGAMRRTRLSSRGQAFVRQLREYTEQKRTIELAGTVTGLRQAGWIVVSPERGPDVNVKIAPKTLAALRLTLWQQVHLEVEVTARINSAGDEMTSHYQFQRALHAKSDV
jgi:hypothetical protein